MKKITKKPLLCYSCRKVMTNKPVEQTNWLGIYAICDVCHKKNLEQKINNPRTETFVQNLTIITLVAIGTFVLFIIIAKTIG